MPDSCYCPHQDLFDIGAASDRHYIIDMPEPAIWSIFSDLVSACAVLQYGAVDEEDANPDWMPIVHRDLKPGNVFLDSREPDDTEYPVGHSSGCRLIEMSMLTECLIILGLPSCEAWRLWHGHRDK